MNATTIRTFSIAALVLAALCASTLAAQPLPAPSAKDDIKSVVKAHSAEVRACYETALAKSPELQGKITVSFNIEPSGQITSAAIQDSTLDHDGLERCVLSAVAGWQFSPRPGAEPLAVSYPFTFNTK
jgi:TonB family protein